MELAKDNFCPVCKYNNDPGATTCINCGAAIDREQVSPSTTIHMEPESDLLSRIFENIRKSHEIPLHGIAIFTINSDVPIAIQEQEQFTLGRKMTGEMDEPFVDLRPFGAYENGVSRRHAIIKRTDDFYDILDLGSTNGTWLEKQRLIPNHPYRLNSGSRIYLGRLQLFVIYQEPEGKP